MNLTVQDTQALGNRLDNLIYFISDHRKLIEKFLVPFANETIEKSDKTLAAVELSPRQPKIMELKGAAYRMAAKKEAREMLDRYAEQMVILRLTEDDLKAKKHQTIQTSDSLTQWVNTNQTALLRTCRDFIEELVDSQWQYEVSMIKLVSGEDMLNNYVNHTTTNEEALMSDLRTWSVSNP